VLFAALDLELPVARAYRFVAIGTLFGYAVPGGTGADVVKLYYLASEHRGRGLEAATILLVDRLIALFSLLAVALTLGVVQGGFLFETALGRGLAATAGGIMLVQGLLTLVAWSDALRGTGAYRWLTERAPGGTAIRRVADALRQLGLRRMSVAQAVGLSMVGHLSIVCMFGFSSRVLFRGEDTLLVVVLALFGMIANAIPLTPGGLGVGEAAFDRLLALVSIPGGAALLLVWRAATIPFAALGFGFYILGPRRREGRSPAVRQRDALREMASGDDDGAASRTLAERGG
jgi:uncharacterized membrane protein YbhN (UPF0104 family)